MSLNWSITECEKWEELKSEENWPITNAIIWLTMGIGMSKITEENYKEFYYRDRLKSAVTMESISQNVNGKITPRPITLEEIKRRIGLSTNATEFTTAEFFKRLRKDFNRKI
jgi:hypothetical protein